MKRCLSILLCVLLLASTTAYAASAPHLQIVGYQQNDSHLDLLVYASDNNNFATDNMSAQLNGTQLTLQRLSAFSSDDYGTAWIVIVEPTAFTDIANLGSNMIESLVKRLGDKDSIAVMDAKNGDMTPFARDLTTAKGFAKEAMGTRGDVKLYEAIHKAISVLHSEVEPNVRKCIVIVSNCVDKSSTYTLDELVTEVKGSDLTVYTVGITKYTVAYNEGYNAVSALSNVTASGRAFKYDNYPDNAGLDAARRILENNANFYVLSASLEGASCTGNDTLSATLYSAKATLEGVKLTAVEDPNAQSHVHIWNDDANCQHARTCTVCGEEDPDGERGPHSYDRTGYCGVCGQPNPSALGWMQRNVWICVMAAALLALVAALVIVLILRKRRKAAAMNDDVPPDADFGTPSKVTIELINRASGEQCTGDIVDFSIKAGRNAPLNLANDASISREHMEFIWQNGILYVQDTNSANGTLVNGREIIGATALHQGDLIHAGESDFVVTWHTNL